MLWNICLERDIKISSILWVTIHVNSMQKCMDKNNLDESLTSIEPEHYDNNSNTNTDKISQTQGNDQSFACIKYPCSHGQLCLKCANSVQIWWSSATLLQCMSTYHWKHNQQLGEVIEHFVMVVGLFSCKKSSRNANVHLPVLQSSVSTSSWACK